MALTLTERHRGISGNRKQLAYTVQFDNSYVTEGEPIAASDFGLVVIDSVQVTGGNVADEGLTGYNVGWNRAKGTLQLWDCGADGDPLDEVANAANVATVKCDIVVVGY